MIFEATITVTMRKSVLVYAEDIIEAEKTIEDKWVYGEETLGDDDLVDVDFDVKEYEKMGRGNVCVTGSCEGLYYVDNEFLDVYSRVLEDGDTEYTSLSGASQEHDYDEVESYLAREDFEYEFSEEMRRRFPSFEHVNKWISRDRRALLENELFYIVLQDNEWSLAIELIQKKDRFGGDSLVGLQIGLYTKYLDGMRDILLEMHGEVGTYDGAWTSGVLKLEDVKAGKEAGCEE